MQQDADFECVECGSQSFRTNESQELVCEECGTLSQLTMPESHEAADAAEARGKAGRAYRLRKGEESQGKPQAAALDVKDCLLAYQYVLKALAESMVRQLGCPGELVEVVEDLWFSYLEEWTAKARYPILQCFLQAKKKSSTKVLRKYDSVAGMVAFRKKRAIENPSRQERIELDRAIRGQAAAAAASHDEEEDQGSTERAEEASQKGGKRRAVMSRKGGPLLQGDISEYAALSLKLGMAFLDAAARQLRLGIMPAHLLRWVEEGSIPLFTAWQYVPQELWSRLDRVWGFFVAKQTTKPHMLASLTARLTFALGLSLPEPNLAVCCRRLVWDMGLPEHVASTCIALLNHHSSAASMRNRQQAPPRDGECSFGQYVWKHGEDPAVPVALVLISSRLDRKWPYWAYHRGPARGGAEEAEMVMVESEEEALQLRRKDLEGYLRYVSDVVLAGEPVWPDDDTHRTLLEGIAGRPRMHAEEAEDEDEELLSSSLPPPVVREAAGVAITGPSQPHRLYDPKDKDGPPVDDGLWALVEHAARAVEVAPAYLLQVTLTLEDKLLGPFQEKGANRGRTQRWWDADIHRNLKWAERFGMDLWAGQSQAQSEGEGGRDEGEEEGSGEDGDDDDDDGDVDNYDDDGDDDDGSDNERPGEGDGSEEDSN